MVPFHYKPDTNIKGKLIALKLSPNFKEFEEQLLNKIFREMQAQNKLRAYSLINKVGVRNLKDAPINQAELAADKIQQKEMQKIEREHIKIDDYIEMKFDCPKSRSI